MKFFVCLFLVFVSLYRCFWNLNSASFERWDEATNVAVVSETLSLNYFPILIYQGKPFFEKPPMWYYINIPVAALIGVSTVSMRMVSAAAGLAVILLTARLAWQWWGPVAGVVSWIILLTTQHLFITNPDGIFSTHTFRSADLDALFLLFIVASFGAKRTVWKGIFAGIAVLTKGPLGFVPIISAGRKSFPAAVGWALIVSVPWYLFMTGTFGFPFLTAHFGYHIVERLFIPIEGHDNSPWLYTRLLINRQVFLSWELLIGSLIWLIAGKKLSDVRILNSVMMTVILFFLPTIAQTKLAWYILPIYPFAALLIAAAAADFAAGLTHFRTCRTIRRAHWRGL
jgi:4-amino-4-deoxy-L-arabinose transferase-like glycosyltransferase